MNWYYISGFFDADGCICLTSRNKGKLKSIQITFHNVDYALLIDIKTFIEQTIDKKGVMLKRISKEEHYLQSYTLRYDNNAAIAVCEKLNSLHYKKQPKIALVLKYYKKVTKRNGKYTQREMTRKLAFERLFFWSF